MKWLIRFLRSAAFIGFGVYLIAFHELWLFGSIAIFIGTFMFLIKPDVNDIKFGSNDFSDFSDGGGE